MIATTPSERAEFAEVAARVALDIARDAIWSGGRCNWLGAQPAAVFRALGAHAGRAALDATLYGGTSGVALFLAEASAAFDDPELRGVALGAIRHALHHADRIDARSSDGLYDGRVGIVYAAVRVSRALDDEEVLDGARAALGAWRSRPASASACCDLMRGPAGALAGLVALTDAFHDRWLVDEAVRLGEQLIAAARVSKSGWSWPAGPSKPGLCGLSHGCAGIGFALLELYGLTGGAGFRRAGEGAFAYERSWFENRGGGWPDLRYVDGGVAWRTPPTAASTWCNGAPGIALARSRARRLLRDAASRRAADAAIDDTRDAADALAENARDFSLCHGAAGIGDVLHAAGQPGPAREVGLRGLELHRGAGFGCGVGGGSTPGLMLGLAGIGLFYLRLADPAVPTPLLVHRAAELDVRRGST